MNKKASYKLMAEGKNNTTEYAIPYRNMAIYFS
jgi:hypothetical protein